jgi:hypothetical protein
MTPNINLRKCDKVRKGRNQKFDEKIFKERFHTIERAFAWEDKFKRLLMRFEGLDHLPVQDDVKQPCVSPLVFSPIAADRAFL